MKKVLIIEDDAVVAHIYGSSLEKRGYATAVCQDGLSGLNRLGEYQPDAVLLDVMLPKINGIDVLKQLRAQPGLVSLPVIVLTNAYVPDMIQEAFTAGASQVFNKANITPQLILDALDQLLNGGKIVLSDTPLNVIPLPPIPREIPGSPPPPSNYGYNDNFTSATRAAPAAKVDNSVFEAEVRQAFLKANAGAPAVLRKLVQSIVKAADEKAREPLLMELYRKIHALTGSGGLSGFGDIAQMASVLEVLLKELIEQPKTVNDSTLRTVTFSVDFIGELFKISQGANELPSFSTLIVDDESLSRRAVAYALKKAHLTFESMDVEDPIVALRLCGEKVFDLIFLDVQMPKINGFELCSKIRALPLNKSTPIIFVTGLSDFKSRAKSTLSGGSDLIAKPFLFVELALKVMMLLLRNRHFPKRKAA